ncbi:MAG TPA: large conductance mechanosensitive channel protein MscL [Rhodoglobus sp.]|nr:large conductance mechanosensitive channel protein MscL [Rhodoglobus sp.]
MKGFREFILRGNVIDLAVAVVIGAAFTAIVNAVVNSVINPAIGALFNAESLATALPVYLPTTSGETATIYFGAVIGALINFVLVALVVYFGLVVPLNAIKRVAFRKQQEEPKQDAPPSELELLTEIRDLLARGPAEASAHARPADTAATTPEQRPAQ